jgi:hypothetical protein
MYPHYTRQATLVLKNHELTSSTYMTSTLLSFVLGHALTLHSNAPSLPHSYAQCLSKTFNLDSSCQYRNMCYHMETKDFGLHYSPKHADLVLNRTAGRAGLFLSSKSKSLTRGASSGGSLKWDERNGNHMNMMAPLTAAPPNQTTTHCRTMSFGSRSYPLTSVM